MVRCFWMFLLAAAACAQDAAPQNWRASLAAAREAWSRLTYRDACGEGLGGRRRCRGRAGE